MSYPPPYPELPVVIIDCCGAALTQGVIDRLSEQIAPMEAQRINIQIVNVSIERLPMVTLAYK